MSENIASQLNLPPLDQVSYVVENMDRALARFSQIYGEFQIIDSVPLKATIYRGQATDIVLKLGFGRSGPIEIELVEVVSGNSPHTEYLQQYGEGQHHVRFTVPDLELVVNQASKLGFDTIWSHQMSSVRFAYLEREGTVIELVEYIS